uniref:Uncharacterized protein n=1 Tax=Wuchereria bancrofti TaxID=6293 RepID=A0AAF5PXK3_WUCBA
MVDIPGSWHQNICRGFIGLTNLVLSNFCKRFGVRNAADLVHEPSASGLFFFVLQSLSRVRNKQEFIRLILIVE